MADVSGATFQSGSNPLVDEDNPLAKRRGIQEEARFDMTAMVDLVFMMNIFFLITTVGAALAEIDLPKARHCTAADPSTSVIVTIIDGGSSGGCLVFLGDRREGTALVDAEEQEQAVRTAVQDGVRDNLDTVLIKAEKSVRLRDIRRVAAAAGTGEGMALKLAVKEVE